MAVYRVDLSEAVVRGLSRMPDKVAGAEPHLGQFAKVLSGIATGANDFFFLTAQQARTLGIPDEFLVPAIGKTRDVIGDEITYEMMKELEANGRPTLLFSPEAPLRYVPCPGT